MGFNIKRRLYVLDFSGTELEGLEIKARGMTLQQALEVQSLGSLAEKKNPGEEEMKQIRETMEFFASKIESWNLENDGAPVAVSADALMGAMDIGDAMMMLEAWSDAVTAVDAPKEQRSSAGSSWLGQPIPMDVPSLSPEMLRTHG